MQQTKNFFENMGNSRSAASGGCSEAVSRNPLKRRRWRIQRSGFKEAPRLAVAKRRGIGWGDVSKSAPFGGREQRTGNGWRNGGQHTAADGGVVNGWRSDGSPSSLTLTHSLLCRWLVLPPAGNFCHQRQKSPKTPQGTDGSLTSFALSRQVRKPLNVVWTLHLPRSATPLSKI